MSLMYEDQQFLKGWVARKQGIVESGAGDRLVYKAPPCLQLVQWSFRDFDRDKELSDISDDEEEMEAEDDDDDDMQLLDPTYEEDDQHGDT